MSLTPDFLEKFPSMARMANRLDSSSFLDSRSSSPEDSETSGFSSGSDHLCDMLVSTEQFTATVLFGDYQLVPQTSKLLSPCFIDYTETT